MFHNKTTVLSRTHPARGGRKAPADPGNPRKAAVETSALAGNPRLSRLMAQGRVELCKPEGAGSNPGTLHPKNLPICRDSSRLGFHIGNSGASAVRADRRVALETSRVRSSQDVLDCSWVTSRNCAGVACRRSPFRSRGRVPLRGAPARCRRTAGAPLRVRVTSFEIYDDVVALRRHMGPARS